MFVVTVVVSEALAEPGGAVAASIVALYVVVSAGGAWAAPCAVAASLMVALAALAAQGSEPGQ